MMFSSRTRLVKRRVVGSFLLVATLASSRVNAQVATIPDGELRIAYRQVQDGESSRTVFQNYLECDRGHCTLTTLTLNQCIFGAFYPKIQHWRTDDGSLSVKLVAPDVVAAELQEQGATFQLRFTFDVREDQLLGRPIFGKLRDFSGGVVKQSSALDKVLTWELAPLRGITSIEFDCPASLDSILE